MSLLCFASKHDTTVVLSLVSSPANHFFLCGISQENECLLRVDLRYTNIGQQGKAAIGAALQVETIYFANIIELV